MAAIKAGPELSGSGSLNRSYPTADENVEISQALMFERTRIRVLADEREYVQKKTFTKWINSHLARIVGVRLHVNDLYMDLRDGRLLLCLLNVITGEKIQRPTRGKMRIHCLENVDKALSFLDDQHVHLENIGAHDIVDGNPSLTLGLVWTIILRFQIQDIIVEAVESSETRSAKDALLLWCQIKTAQYDNINVKNFTTSWRDGLAFNALIHKHRPDLINYRSLKKEHVEYNLNNAFEVADKKLGINRLLDIEDVAVEFPDEKSIMTYVVTLYHYFSKVRADTVQGRRISRVIGMARDIERHYTDYEERANALLRWISRTSTKLSSRDFPNNLERLQLQLFAFNNYRTSEKPKWLEEKGRLQVHFCLLQGRLRMNNQSPRFPRSGLSTFDLDKSWTALEVVEHDFEIYLNEELMRQQRLEQVAQRFKRKAALREKWLQDSQRLVACDRFGSDLSSVEAAFKKQEAIQTDIGSFHERLTNLLVLCTELEREGYHDIVTILSRKKRILFLWEYLLELVRARRRRLEASYHNQKMLSEIDFLLRWIDEIIVAVDKEDVSANLLQIGDMMQCHDLLKNDIAVIGDRVERVLDAVIPFIVDQEKVSSKKQSSTERMSDVSTNGHPTSTRSQILNVWQPETDSEQPQLLPSASAGNVSEYRRPSRRPTSLVGGLADYNNENGDDDEFKACNGLLYERVDLLKLRYQCLVEASLLRDGRLQAGLVARHVLEDIRNEHEWIKLKSKELRNMIDEDIASGALATKSTRNRFETIRAEMKMRENKIIEVSERAQNMNDTEAFDQCIKPAYEALQSSWLELKESADYRDAMLSKAQSLQSFQANADEINAWLLEMLRLCSCEDVGKDEHSSLSLMAKHSEVRDTLIAYGANIEDLKADADAIVKCHDVGQDKEVIENLLENLRRRHHELIGLCALRQQKLEDAVAWFRLVRDVDNVEAWIEEKERFLRSLNPSQAGDIEELEIMKHRFDGFDREMLSSASKVAVVNQLGRQHVSDDHPNSKDILERLSTLNDKWADLRKLIEIRRDELHSTFGVQTFHIECDETITWIEDKVKIVQSTEKLDKDLAGVISMQRRLSGLERDLNAIQTKLDQLDMEAEKLEKTHPQEAEAVQRKINHINSVWYELKDTLRRREESMGEAAVLQRFLRDLDHFSQWLTRTQTQVASEDTPDSLQSAEQILNKHQSIKEEIDRYAPDYGQMREYGQRVIRDADSSDPQYVFLRERLNALDDGWNELDQMWHQKQNMLSEAMHLQMYDRDAAQAELLLNKQEYYLGGVGEPKCLDEAEALVKAHDDFITSLLASEEKIQQLWQFAQRLVHESHFASDRIMDKARSTVERFSLNRNKAMDISDRLRESVKFFQFTQDCDDLKEWLDSKTAQAQDDSYRDTTNIHSKYLRHQAFSAEIIANRERLKILKQNAFELEEEQPASVNAIELRLTELDQMWDALEDVTKSKGERLFDSNRDTLYQQCISDVNRFVSDLEQQFTVVSDEQITVPSEVVCETDVADMLKAIAEVDADMGGDLTRTNLALTKQAVLEREFVLKQQQVEALREQAEKLKSVEPERSDSIDAQRVIVEERFNAIRQPMEAQKLKLARQKRVHQLLRDIEDECMWAEEQRIANAITPDIGSLLAARSAISRNDAIKMEVEGRIKSSKALKDEAEELSTEVSSSRVDEFKCKLANLDKCFNDLLVDIEKRQLYLNQAMNLQKFLVEVEESQTWIGEHELLAMIDDTGRDETVTRSLAKKHKQVESSIIHFDQQLQRMHIRLQQESGDLKGEEKARIAYAQLCQSYNGLKDLSARRMRKLNDALQLHLVKREIDDLRQWIAEREAICNSNELGVDFEHVALLKQRFQTFCEDTTTRGYERVAEIEKLCFELGKHPEHVLIFQWKERVAVECWSDLLEMLSTRKEALELSYQLQKYFYECREAISLIAERQNGLSDQLGRDSKSVFALQRKHVIFEQDLISVRTLVSSIYNQCAMLSDLYAGERAIEVLRCQDDVKTAWNNLQLMLNKRNTELSNCADMHRFFNLARDLTIWMEGILRQMRNTAAAGARDVSGVDLLINNHHGLKAEIAARDENFTMCVNMGKDLLAKKHNRGQDIKDRCIQLCLLRDRTANEWEDEWDRLQLELEVYQFARDASVAEAWLVSQESYLQVIDLGRSLDEVENLIKKHEAFEKSIIAQEDRFNALKQLTSLEKRGQEPPKIHSREDKRADYEFEFRTWEEKEIGGGSVSPHTDATAAGKQPSRHDGALHVDSSVAKAHKQHSVFDPRSTISTALSGAIGDTSAAGKLVFAGVSTDLPDLQPPTTAPPQQLVRNIREGYLVRKHIWENFQQKASNRSWEKYFFILSKSSTDGYTLEMYKDHKRSTRKKVEDLWTLDSSCQIEPATDYHKRSNVFRLTLSSGACYMFMARDFDDMHDWIEIIRSNCSHHSTNGTSTAIQSSIQVSNDPLQSEFIYNQSSTFAPLNLSGNDGVIDLYGTKPRTSSTSRSLSLPLNGGTSDGNENNQPTSKKQAKRSPATMDTGTSGGFSSRIRGRSRDPSSSSSRKERGKGFFSIRRRKTDHQE